MSRFVARKAASLGAATERYSPQQVLRLCTNLHRAYVAKDREEVRALGAAMLPMLHAFRPSEVAMALNHFAHLKVLDLQLWQPISDSLADVFLDYDCKALGLAANAYARASLKHESALAFIAESAQALAAEGELEGRNIAMLVNGYSKLRCRDPALMEALAEQLLTRSAELNEIDLATVANGFARLALSNDRLFDALRVPTMEAMEKFSVQNLAMLANAHARVMRRDTELLGLIATELRRRCDTTGQPIPAKYLPSIVHAYAMKLALCPPDFVHMLEFSLPRVVAQMEKSDVILTVPSLVQVSSLRAPVEFRRPVFSHCLSLIPEFTGNAVVSVLEAALFLVHDCRNFWQQSLGFCQSSLRGGHWESQYVSRLALLIAEAWATPAASESWPPFNEAQKDAIFEAVAASALRVPSGRAFPLADLADLAVAIARAAPQNSELTQFVLEESRGKLAQVPSEALAAAGAEAAARAERHQAKRLLDALQHMHGQMLLKQDTVLAAACQRLA